MTWYRDGIPCEGAIGLAQFFHAVDTGFHRNVVPDSTYFNRRYEVITTRMVAGYRVDFKIINAEDGEITVGDHHERYRLGDDWQMRLAILKTLEWIEWETRRATAAVRSLISESGHEGIAGLSPTSYIQHPASSILHPGGEGSK